MLENNTGNFYTKLILGTTFFVLTLTVGDFDYEVQSCMQTLSVWQSSPSKLSSPSQSLEIYLQVKMMGKTNLHFDKSLGLSSWATV